MRVKEHKKESELGTQRVGLGCQVVPRRMFVLFLLHVFPVLLLAVILGTDVSTPAILLDENTQRRPVIQGQ